MSPTSCVVLYPRDLPARRSFRWRRSPTSPRTSAGRPGILGDALSLDRSVFAGGRSLTVAGVAGDPATYYFGAAGGGVWKTTDGAVTWSPIFDRAAGVFDWRTGGGAPPIAMSSTWVPGRPRCAATSRRATACTNPPMPARRGPTWDCTISRAIGKILIHPHNPEIAPGGCSGTSVRTERGAGCFSALPMAARRGTRFCTRTRTLAPWISASIRTIRISCSLRFGRRDARRGAWTMADRVAGLHRSADGGVTWKQVQGGGLPRGAVGQGGDRGGGELRSRLRIDPGEGGRTVSARRTAARRGNW